MVISIIAILAGFALPAMQGALLRAQLITGVSNGRQIYIAAQQADLDAQSQGTTNFGFPYDVYGSSAQATIYFANLVTNGYLSTNDMAKLVAIGGVPMASGGTGPTMPTAGTTGFNIGNVSDSDDGSAIFLYSKNLNPPSAAASAIVSTVTFQSAGTTGRMPYGTRGFVIFHKGGDGASFNASATNSPNGFGTAPASGSWPTFN